MASNNIGKNSKATRVGKIVAGTRKHFTNGSQQITLAGASTTIDGAVNELQSFIDNRSAVVAAQATAKTKLAAEMAAMPALDAFISAFIGFIKVTFGSQADVLADFGIPAPKARAPQTAEQKAVAAAKRKATREKRGTLGPKAKKAVKGNVTAELVVTPVTTVPAAEAPEAPATAPIAAAPGGVPAPPAKA